MAGCCQPSVLRSVYGVIISISILKDTRTNSGSWDKPVMSDILEIACDEAGHTGPDLLQRDQRMFAFSSVAIGDAEAFELVRKARADHPVQMPEFKATKLLATDRGRKLIAALLTAMDGRYIVSVNDKLLALCG